MSSFVQPLADYSVDELLTELRLRGFIVTVAPAGDNAPDANATQRHIFQVLDSIEQWCKQDRHRNDKDRKFQSVWLYLRAFDWARKPKGYVCDANKSLKIGSGEYSKYEDPESVQILMIQHFDSERPGNYEKRNSWGDVPPVWAIAFSCAEIKELTKTVVEKAATEGTLIHREPEGDIEPDEPWYSESHWLIEHGKITGVKLVVKCTQDIEPKIEYVRFKMRGSTFEFIGTEVINSGTHNYVNVDIPLPQPEQDIVASMDYLKPPDNNATVVNTNTTIAVEGDSALEIRLADNSKSSTSNYNDFRHDALCQSLTSGILVITNPTETRIAITEYWVEIFYENEWMKSIDSRVGIQHIDYYGHARPQFLEGGQHHSFEIESHSSLELLFEGSIRTKKYGKSAAYNGQPHCSRIHTAFPNPLKGRIFLKDETGKCKIIYYSYENPPLDNLWLTYDEAVAKTTEQKDGFGELYQPEMWICVENPLDLNKCIICVTTLKEDPHHWFIRCESDRRDIGGSYHSVGPVFFKRQAFKASLEKEHPLEIDVELPSAKHCKITGLVDYQTKMIYALHGMVEIKDHVDQTIVKVERFVKLDYNRVTEEEK